MHVYTPCTGFIQICVPDDGIVSHLFIPVRDYGSCIVLKFCVFSVMNPYSGIRCRDRVVYVKIPSIGGGHEGFQRGGRRMRPLGPEPYPGVVRTWFPRGRV